MCPAKTQISLGIRPVWSEPSLCAQWVAKDWADAQADLSLRWAYMPLCWFCHEAAHLYSFSGIWIILIFMSDDEPL